MNLEAGRERLGVAEAAYPSLLVREEARDTVDIGKALSRLVSKNVLDGVRPEGPGCPRPRGVSVCLGGLTKAHPDVFGHPMSLHFCGTGRGVYCCVSNQPRHASLLSCLTG